MNYNGRNISIREMLNLCLAKIESQLSQRRLRPFKTFWINFRTLPFKHAIKFPIYVYGKVNVVSLSGKIVFNCPVKRRLVSLGIKSRFDLNSSTYSIFENNGTIIINGKTTLYNGFIIGVDRGAELIIGRNFAANNGAVIKVSNKVIIGDHVRFSFNVKVLSSDYHYIVKTASRSIKTNRGNIIIGACNWMTSDVKIFKGTITPNWIVVTANSILNKDYTNIVPENSMVGGTPLKVLTSGLKRVFSEDGITENMLNDYFRDDSNHEYKLNDDIKIENFCKK